MCGIAGIVHFAGGALDRVDRARRMSARLRHRGPDGSGEVLSPWAVLEHRRLALVDPGQGAQPMQSPDGRFSLVYNGELYDHEALRRRLPYPFRTRCDAETLLAAYATWGADCITHLNGMFAFFVWDARLRRGFAGRDPLGVKPFAYRWHEGELAFASEAQALLEGVRARPRHWAMLEQLVAPAFSGVEAPMFEEIEYLPPGHCLEVSEAGPVTRRYFHYRVESTPAPVPAPAELRDALGRAVDRCLTADAPLGLYLSGGLDSTAIAAFSRHRATLPAFTVAFEGMADYDYDRSLIVASDDRPLAESAARDLGLPLRQVEVPRSALAADLERVSRTNDALPAWEQEIAQDHLAQAAACEVKGVLVGDAADETHCGYHFLLDEAATASPRAILERFGSVPIRSDVLDDPIGHFARKYSTWTNPDGDRAARLAGTIGLIVDRWLPRLLHNGDIHAMRWSLEARVPFADLDLLRLAQAIPAATALAGGREKAHLREALRGVIPETIRGRRKSALPKDQGAEPVYRAEAARLFTEPPAVVDELVDLRRVRERLRSPAALHERERAAIFRVICLTHFCRHHGLA
ncbi:MAG TPA: asparagine synthase (glutamine-hydrolyzing) [Myxococcales bacterium]|nr:asparagine synthase (glutamine-hydrolyzing) [Myxococcales bacterium]